LWHQEQHFLGSPGHHRDHHDGQSHATGKGREMSLGEHNEAISNQPNHNGRHSVQNISGKTYKGPKSIASVFCEVDASPNSERNTNQACHAKNQSRANDRVGHSTANLSYGFGGVREESPVDRSRALNKQVGKNRDQRSNDNG